jgi:hypothetical protein
MRDLEILFLAVLTHRVTRFHTGNIIKWRDDVQPGNILHGLMRVIAICYRL